MVRTGGLDFDDALERVEQLMQVVGVPRRHEVVGVLGPRAGAYRCSGTQLHQRCGRYGPIFGRRRGDDHGVGL